jgi:hypothetical protein
MTRYRFYVNTTNDVVNILMMTSLPDEMIGPSS